MSCVPCLRKEIDILDKAILDLINQRLKYVSRIAELKHEQQMALYDPSREEAIIKSLQEYNEGPLSRDSVHCIFQTILNLSKSYMKT